MIQRIQTIYLLVVAIIMTIPLYVPIAQLLIPNDASYNFFTYGVVLIGENSVLQAHYWALLIMNIFTIGVPLVNVFLFKKRFLQLRGNHLIDRCHYLDVVSHQSIRGQNERRDSL